MNGLYGHAFIAHREGGPVVGLQWPTPLQPLPGDDGARGLTAEVGGAQVFDQDGRGAADDGSSYGCWSTDSAAPNKRREEATCEAIFVQHNHIVFCLNNHEK